MWSQFFLSGYDATYVCKYLLHMAIFCIESFTFHILNLELVLTANPGLSSLVFTKGFHGNPRFWPIRRGRLCTPHYCGHLQIFRPSNCPKIEYLTKNWISNQKWTFYQKLSIYPKIESLAKNWIFNWKLNIWPKIRKQENSAVQLCFYVIRQFFH